MLCSNFIKIGEKWWPVVVLTHTHTKQEPLSKAKKKTTEKSREIKAKIFGTTRFTLDFRKQLTIRQHLGFFADSLN